MSMPLPPFDPFTPSPTPRGSGRHSLLVDFVIAVVAIALLALACGL